MMMMMMIELLWSRPCYNQWIVADNVPVVIKICIGRVLVCHTCSASVNIDSACVRNYNIFCTDWQLHSTVKNC